MNMMKWKSKHRQEDSSQLATSLAHDVHVVLPQSSETNASSFPSGFVDLGRDSDTQTTPKESPRVTELLITKDIEALLEEDERARAKERQVQQDRGSKLGKLDPSSVGGLPPPPRRAHQPRHYKFQSEYKTPMSSGRSGITSEGSKEVRRPSTTGGAVSPASVSRRSSIKDVPIDTYTVYDRASVEEGMLLNRLSEFGPRQSRRSSGGPDRGSWGAASGFSTSAGTTPPPVSVDVSRPAAQQPSRPLLAHAPLSSRESVYSAVSSIDPASTIHERRISVSSTIYPASAYNELPSPVATPVGSDQLGVGHRDSLFYSEADSIYVEDQRQYIVDTSSHTSAECDTPVPQRTAFAIPVGIYPNGDKSIYETDIAASPRRSLSSSFDVSSRRASGQKPALPTTPKPDFRRSRSVQPPSKIPMISKPPSRSSSPKLPGLVPYHLLTTFSPSHSNRDDSLPPTTNNLNPQERADLIRKTRKLTQVFGQTPSPMSGSEDPADSPVLNNCLLPVLTSRKAHARGAMSVSDALSVPGAISLRDTCIPTIGAERTDSLSPIRFRGSSSGPENDSDDSMSPFDSPDAATPLSSRKKSGDAMFRSPTIISASDSFIEMAEQDNPSLIRFPSICSFAESITEEQKAEDERRRKRERLAKLHRFLGSRVPMELVLGPGLDVPLPPVAPDLRLTEPASEDDASPAARLWVRNKRRNSLASSDPLERLADTERLKEELSDKEKAIIVKRAQKMERMFGEQPPQDLLHSAQTRPSQRATTKIMSQSKSPARSAPSSPIGGNINKSAYQKHKSRHDNRPGTAESSKRLLGPSFDSGETGSINDGHSDIYYHYRSSLVSLTNIVDNDDRKSLVELHEYINEDLSRGGRDKRESYSSASIRSERRRSLPLRASYSSLSSQYTITETKMEITPFEVRRRRAAKLSQFFGVSYRDLFGEVLDSLEISVREDEGKGALNADQAKDLLVQLTKLKARRDELS